MLNVKETEIVIKETNPYYEAYISVTKEDERSYFEYIVWISKKWETWRKEAGHRGGLEDKDREAFQNWLKIKKETLDATA